MSEESWIEPPKPLRLKSGTDFQLEDDADKLLAEGRRGLTSIQDKTDYLSREQLALRRSKETYNMHGVPDASLYSGMYRRSFNPLAGRRPKGLKTSDD